MMTTNLFVMVNVFTAFFLNILGCWCPKFSNF